MFLARREATPFDGMLHHRDDRDPGRRADDSGERIDRGVIGDLDPRVNPPVAGELRPKVLDDLRQLHGVLDQNPIAGRIFAAGRDCLNWVMQV